VFRSDHRLDSRINMDQAPPVQLYVIDADPRQNLPVGEDPNLKANRDAVVGVGGRDGFCSRSKANVVDMAAVCAGDASRSEVAVHNVDGGGSLLVLDAGAF
jgi:hypothetical protein